MKILKRNQIETPLGPMLAIGDERALYLLEFTDRKDLTKELYRFQLKMDISLETGWSDSLRSIEQELNQYFQGTLSHFKTPLIFCGTRFQECVWKALQEIPIGTTRSYLEMAKAIEHPKAARAVARANSTNQLAIIVPCHRVIQSNGDPGGYAANPKRKKWLLDHERAQKVAKSS